MLAIAKRPWPTLTLAFVMIGQNRQASFRQAKADHDFEQEETEPRTGTRIVRGSLRADADIFSSPSGHAASAFAFAYAVARDQPRLRPSRSGCSRAQWRTREFSPASTIQATWCSASSSEPERPRW